MFNNLKIRTKIILFVGLTFFIVLSGSGFLLYVFISNTIMNNQSMQIVNDVKIYSRLIEQAIILQEENVLKRLDTLMQNNVVLDDENTIDLTAENQVTHEKKDLKIPV